MPVQSDTELGVFQNWTLRVRAATERPAHLLLLLHGWTGDENSMWVFVRNFAARYWIVAPRAPYATEPAGYSWRAPSRGKHERPTFQDLIPAADSVLSLVDSYATANSLEASRFEAIGFSQGAALVGALALLHPDRIERAALLAGFVPPEAEDLVKQKPLRGTPLFVAHGTLDELVKVNEARRSAKILEEAGAQVTYCEDEVGHKLSAKCLRALQAFFA